MPSTKMELVVITGAALVCGVVDLVVGEVGLVGVLLAMGSALEAIQSLMRDSIMRRGDAPSFRISSWNSRMSNLLPKNRIHFLRF